MYQKSKRTKDRQRPNAGFFISLAVLIGAFAFYGFASFHSGIKNQSAQSQSVSSQVSVHTQAAERPSQSSPAPAGKATPTAAEKQEQPPQVDLRQAVKPLWVKVNLPGQNVVVYDARNRQVKKFICSTGMEGSDTPTGTYTVQLKGESFFSREYQEGGYYWTQFKGNYLFHSVPFDKNRQIEPAEAQKLGTKASHGCVRLSIGDAKWIYENIPKGTKVVIA